MLHRRLVSPPLLALALGSSLAGLALWTLIQSAIALPPAGADEFNVTGQVEVSSRLGTETIDLTGTVLMERGDPQMEGDIEVVDTEIVALNLAGQSITGPVTVTLSEEPNSIGELRSLQPGMDFPASSYFDVYFHAGVPGSPQATLNLHSETAAHIVPMSEGSQVPLNAWPPIGVSYGGEFDPCIRMLRDTTDPRDPNPWLPAQVCVLSVSLTIDSAKTPVPTDTPCPECTPTATRTPTGTVPPTFTQTRTPTFTPTPRDLPEDPSYSVAPGGPSNLHPADVLAIGEPGPGPGPVQVSGNDNFANAWEIGSLPFAGKQNKNAMTVEDGEPRNPLSCISAPPNQKGHTVWYRFTAPSSGSYLVTTGQSQPGLDTVAAVYTGNALVSLTPVACDDDAGPGLTAEFTFIGNAGTVYYVQVGGFNLAAGDIVLEVIPPAASGAAGTAASRIPCANLGLTLDGCDSGGDGDQDDIDGLSYGADFGGNEVKLAFSVAPGSSGLGSTAVAQQTSCGPPQAQADEFSSTLDGTNTMVFDGDGEGPSCPTTTAIGLVELPASDDLDALNEQPPSFVDPDGNGVPNAEIFLTLAPGSPTLASLGRSPADILFTAGGGTTPGAYASASALGLQTTDAIDAICVKDTGDGAIFGAGDTVYFSLAPGSPTLGTMGASAADIFMPGPAVVVEAGQLGLLDSDNVDALKCMGQPGGAQQVTVQVGDIWFCGPAFQNTPCETTINVGDSILWDFRNATLPHSATACGASCDSPTGPPLFDSGIIDEDDAVRTFKFTFDTPGTYNYYCLVHNGQRGRIIVQGGAATPTPTRTRTPTRTPTPMGRPGDANCDGAVTAVDATLVLQFTARLLSRLSCQQNADINRDGRVDALDAALILQRVAGLG